MLAMSRSGYLRVHPEENLRENIAITALSAKKTDPAFSQTVMTALMKNNIFF